MNALVHLTPLLFFLGGVALTLWGLKYRTEKHPGVPAWNPKRWVPIWKAKELFTPLGYKLHVFGWLIVFISVFFLRDLLSGG